MALHHNPRIVTSGLVLALDAADINSYSGSGTTWYDLSGNENHGTLTNGASYGDSNGGVIVFDGSNDYVTLSGGSAGNDLHAWTADGSVGSTVLCYEIWHKGTDGSGRIISKPWNGAGSYNISIYPNIFELRVGTGIPNSPDEANNIPLPNLVDGNWHQLVVWATSSDMGYYFDGNSNSGSISHGLTGGAGNYGQASLPLGLMSLYFYGEGWSGNTGFSNTGDIGLFRKYSRILTAEEVLQNYNATKTRFGL